VKPDSNRGGLPHSPDIAPHDANLVHLLDRLLAVVRMGIDNLLDLVIAAKEDARPVVDVLRDHLKHALHVRVDGLAASYPHDQCQRHVSKSRRDQIRIQPSFGDHLPFSKTMAIGAHSYRILSLPFGLFLSAGYAKMPPYSRVR
jgi:hypothetical protein